jgi:hypothetical protein
MKNILAVFVLFITFSAQAQYRLSFEKPTLEGSKFRITLRMTATSKGFAIGSNNLRFNYPIAGLANPKIISEVFPSALYHETTLIGSNPQTGIVSVNTVFYGKAKTNKMPITTKGIDLVEMEFDVLNETLITQLDWRTNGKQPKTVVISDDKLSLVEAINTNNPISEVKNVKFTPTIKQEGVLKLMIVSIMPNPAKDDINIVFDAIQNGNIQLEITDVSGRLVKSQKIEANKGSNSTMLNISAFAYGTYWIKISDGSTEVVEKIIKQ